MKAPKISKISKKKLNKTHDSGEIPHQGHDLPDPRRGRAEVREAQVALPL